MRGFLLFVIGTIYPITAIILHIWTIGIAYTESGLLAAIVSAILPVLSEIYWVIAMWGINDAYVTLALIHVAMFFIWGWNRRR